MILKFAQTLISKIDSMEIAVLRELLKLCDNEITCNETQISEKKSKKEKADSLYDAGIAYNNFADFLYQNDYISLLVHARNCFMQAKDVTIEAKTSYQNLMSKQQKKATSLRPKDIELTNNLIELYDINMHYMENHCLITSATDPCEMPTKNLIELTQDKPCYLLFKSKIYLFDEKHALKKVDKNTEFNITLFPSEIGKIVPVISEPLNTTKKRALEASSSSSSHFSFFEPETVETMCLEEAAGILGTLTERTIISEEDDSILPPIYLHNVS